MISPQSFRYSLGSCHVKTLQKKGAQKPLSIHWWGPIGPRKDCPHLCSSNLAMQKSTNNLHLQSSIKDSHNKLGLIMGKKYVMCLSVTITDHFYVVPGGKPGLVWWVCPKSMGKPWLCYKNCHKLRLGPHFQAHHLHSRVRLFDIHSSHHPMGSMNLSTSCFHMSCSYGSKTLFPCSSFPNSWWIHYRSSSSSLVNHHGESPWFYHAFEPKKQHIHGFTMVFPRFSHVS